jgi:putative CocE/NonD family hydrolase
MWTVPWSALPDSVFEDEKEAIFAYMREPMVDMWKLDEAAANTGVPNLNVCGWYDHCNSINLHQAITARGASETARRDSRLIVGPWAHHTLGHRKTGQFDFGANAAVDLDKLQIAWFDHFLKHKENDVLSGAPVRVFVMGRNEWRDEQVWPPERAKGVRMYLAGGGHANTPGGDGLLVEAAPGEAGADHYTYDPKDPVPSLFEANGYAICADQNRNRGRRDVLVYQTGPLGKAIEVTGEPVVELFASSSAADTDWIVKLVDVSPEDVARDVSTGVMRARYRGGFDKERFLTPGEVVKYTIHMKATSNEFLAGHRIRVDVTSSDFPSYDRNHNTAVNQNFDGELRVAEQTVLHGGATASAIVLPVMSK